MRGDIPTTDNDKEYLGIEGDDMLTCKECGCEDHECNRIHEESKLCGQCWIHIRRKNRDKLRDDPNCDLQTPTPTVLTVLNNGEMKMGDLIGYYHFPNASKPIPLVHAHDELSPKIVFGFVLPFTNELYDMLGEMDEVKRYEWVRLTFCTKQEIDNAQRLDIISTMIERRYLWNG